MRFVVLPFAALAAVAISSDIEAAQRLAPSAWTAKPGAADFARCMPGSTDIRPGEALLICKVQKDGHLTDCSARSSRDPRLEEWALCVSTEFRTSHRRQGQSVEIPLRWASPD